MGLSSGGIRADGFDGLSEGIDIDAVDLVTHDVEEAAALADRVLVMEEGRIIADYTTQNLPLAWSLS